jgi:hypothetical protein
MDLFKQGMNLLGGNNKKALDIVDRVKRSGVVGALKGTYEPVEGTPVVDVAELRKRLEQLGTSGVPFEVREEEDDKHGELVARWKIMDAVWWKSFRHVGVNSITDLHLKLDVEMHEVRELDDARTVKWNGQIPKLDKGKEENDGNADRSAWWRADDPLNPGELRNYYFDSTEIKDIVGTVITDAGWTMKQVYRKKTLREGKD